MGYPPGAREKPSISGVDRRASGPEVFIGSGSRQVDRGASSIRIVPLQISLWKKNRQRMPAAGSPVLLPFCNDPVTGRLQIKNTIR